MSTTSKSQGNRVALAVSGVFVFHLLCCGLPLLIAAGTLGATGSVLGNPWLIAAAVALTAGALIWTLRRRGNGASRETEGCCAPGAASDQDPALDRVVQRTGGC